VAVKSIQAGAGHADLRRHRGPDGRLHPGHQGQVNPTVDSEDAITTLSGDTLGGARTYGAELDVTAVQDLDTAGLVAWSWAHKGEDVPFTYTPYTAVGIAITGTVTVDPSAHRRGRRLEADLGLHLDVRRVPDARPTT
jgi:hypothetical protein